jgi:hypothetical protein
MIGRKPGRALPNCPHRLDVPTHSTVRRVCPRGKVQLANVVLRDAGNLEDCVLAGGWESRRVNRRAMMCNGILRAGGGFVKEQGQVAGADRGRPDPLLAFACRSHIRDLIPLDRNRFGFTSVWKVSLQKQKFLATTLDKPLNRGLVP